MKIQFDHDAQTYRLELAQHGQTITINLDGQTYTVEILRAGQDWLDIRFSASPSVPETVFTAHISSNGPRRWVTVNGQTFMLTQSSGALKRGGQAGHAAGALTAPMPGQIRAVQAGEGDSVTKGQTLVILEAMKMELKVAAPFDGVVKIVKVQPGQNVEKDELLLEIESKIQS